MEELTAGRLRDAWGRRWVRLRIAKVRKGDSGRVRFEVKKLKDLEVRNASNKAMWRPASRCWVG